jgi:CspA family cold shock protein
MLMLRGTVKWFSGAKGFGFISAVDGGADVFFHRTKVEGDHGVIPDNHPVEYQIGHGRRGPEAVVVRIT